MRLTAFSQIDLLWSNNQLIGIQYPLDYQCSCLHIAAIFTRSGKSLESLLSRYVCGQPLRLKSDPNLRKPVLTILERLFDPGPSAAHIMHDDFVTSMSYTKGSG